MVVGMNTRKLSTAVTIIFNLTRPFPKKKSSIAKLFEIWSDLCLRLFCGVWVLVLNYSTLDLVQSPANLRCSTSSGADWIWRPAHPLLCSFLRVFCFALFFCLDPSVIIDNHEGTQTRSCGDQSWDEETRQSSDMVFWEIWWINQKSKSLFLLLCLSVARSLSSLSHCPIRGECTLSRSLLGWVIHLFISLWGWSEGW